MTFLDLFEQDWFILLIIFEILLLTVIVVILTKHSKKRKPLSDWKPFDFMEKYFHIPRPKKINWFQLFSKGKREDFFYIHIADKINLSEKNEYLRIRKKIKKYELKWQIVLWTTPFMMIIFTSYLKEYPPIHYMLIFVILLCIIKLQIKPYRNEFLTIQRDILEKMYFYLFIN